MAAEFAPTDRGGGDLCRAGRIYRFQKNLAGWHMRWKCAKADWDSKRIGYAVTDEKGPGSAIIRFGEHDQRCEPCASTTDVATSRRAVIDTVGRRALCEPSPNVWTGHRPPLCSCCLIPNP